MNSQLKCYRYKAVTSAGEIVNGMMSSVNGEAISRELSARGYTLLRYRRVWFRGGSAKSKWTRRDMIHFVFHLEQMLAAGISIVEALQEFSLSTDKKYLKSVADDLLDGIDGGRSLSAACMNLPQTFPAMVVSMIEAGEQSGKLEQVLRELGELLKWQDKSITRLRRVLIYPAFVAVVLFSVVIFIMTWLVPGMVSFISAAGGTLPWHTRALIATSEWVTHYWLIVSVVVVAAIVLLRLGAGISNQVQLNIDRLILNLPLLGPVLLKTRLARFSRCASLMYSAGINIVDVLGYSSGTLDNQLLEYEAEKVGQRLVDGKGIAGSFNEARGFPPLMGRLLRVGESTGALDVSFNQLGYVYDRESRELTEKLEQSLGPVMTVSVGLIMMWVVISVIGPIYDLVFGMSSGSF